jgi:hypothetical protein
MGKRGEEPPVREVGNFGKEKRGRERGKEKRRASLTLGGGGFAARSGGKRRRRRGGVKSEECWFDFFNDVPMKNKHAPSQSEMNTMATRDLVT